MGRKFQSPTEFIVRFDSRFNCFWLHFVVSISYGVHSSFRYVVSHACIQLLEFQSPTEFNSSFRSTFLARVCGIAEFQSPTEFTSSFRSRTAMQSMRVRMFQSPTEFIVRFDHQGRDRNDITQCFNLLRSSLVRFDGWYHFFSIFASLYSFDANQSCLTKSQTNL